MQIGAYTVERLVEQRGSVTVYTAHHTTTGQPLLLTTFRPDSLDTAYRWSERVKLVGTLRHAGIVRPGEGNRTADGVPVVVTPLTKPVLSGNKLLSPASILTILAQIAPALDYAHGQGVMHGLLRASHIVQIGVGRFALRGFELAGGDDAPYTRGDDFASLGNFIHRALTGENASGGNIAARIPPALAAVIRKALQADDGFASAGAICETWEQAVTALPARQRTRTLDGTRENISAAGRKGLGASRVLIVFTLIALAASAVLVSAALLLRSGTPPAPTQLRLEQPNTASATPPTPTAPPAAITAAPSLTLTTPPSAIPTISPSATPTFTPTFAATFTSTPASTPTSTLTAAASATATPPILLIGSAESSGQPVAQLLTITPEYTDYPAPTATLFGVVTATPLNVLTDTPTPTGTATLTPQPAKPCVAMVGDSVTHGGITYLIPDQGYIIGLTRPVADVLNEQMRAQGINDLVAYDRGVSNTGINSTNHSSYFGTAAYMLLLNDRCRYIVIMPWFNDMTPGNDVVPTDAAPQHTRALIALVREIVNRSPNSRIFVMTYFEGAVAPFALQSWATGYTPENRDLYNREIRASCQMGSLSRIAQVVCLQTDDAFAGMGKDYVIGFATRQEISESLVYPLSDIQQIWMDDYFSVNPAAKLQGDGIHLNLKGKRALAQFLIKAIQSYPDTLLESTPSPSPQAQAEQR